MAVKRGDTIKLHYTAKFDNGVTFDTSEGQDPVEFKVGAKQVIDGVDEAVIGLEQGEKKIISINPEKGYGPYEDDLIREAPKEILGGQEVQRGEIIQLQTADGEIIPAQVIDSGDESVTFDLNHPLAGKVLNFEIEIVNVKAA